MKLESFIVMKKFVDFTPMKTEAIGELLVEM